jgi:RHS repeat-associated protein
MLVPNRHASSNSYRYGFQGQEKDDEIKGEGNSLNYTFRMHDPRVGRFFATDPLEKYYAEQTPYQFSSNAPIHARELEGCETAFDMRFERRERQLLAGEITPQQFREQNNAEGLGALLGVALLATVYTGGKAAPLISNGYRSYCTWFGTTHLSNYMATATVGSVTTAFTVNSTRAKFVGGFSSFGSQYVFNGFTTEGMDYGDVTTSTLLGGSGGLFTRSAIDIKAESGFKINSLFDTTMNYGFGKLSSNINSSISKEVGAPLFNYSFMGAYVEGISQSFVKGTLSLVKKELDSAVKTTDKASTSKSPSSGKSYAPTNNNIGILPDWGKE